MYEVHLLRSDGKIVVLKYSSRCEAEEAFRFAEKYQFEVLTNPICDGCSKRGHECVGTKNFVWTGCVDREGIA